MARSATTARDPLRPSAPPIGRCPCCGAGNLQPIHETVAPIHTSKLVDDAGAARDYPRATIRLELCRRCGFMTNSAFDAPAHDYSASYEETQAFSPRFQQFASSLARQLGASFELAGREVVEIGCGRGDFLDLLCRTASCRGRGIDPSFRAEDRVETGEGVTFERSFFGAHHIDGECALVVCRHTLEHVHDVSGFLAEVRRGLERAPKAGVFFEVPDTTRILRETAFWDVFYEHCSYFTPGSLARAFRGAGFEVGGLELGYDGQYVLLTASTSTNRDRETFALEDDPEEVNELADRFARDVEAARARWSNTLRRSHARGERTVLWGAGSKGVGFIATIGLRDEVSHVVDVNPAKHGMYMIGSGHEIVAPARLPEIRPDHVIVMNPVYVDEIRASLRELGLAPSVSAL